MNKNKIEELKAKLAAKQKENEVKIKEAAEIATLEASLLLEVSNTLFDAKVKLATEQATNDKLLSVINSCKAIIDNTPVKNTRTRELHKWRGNKRYAFATPIDLMHQIATGILYSAEEHKKLLLAYTDLPLGLLETVVEGFGSTSYYNNTYNEIVEAKPYDCAKAIAALNVMQSKLGIAVEIEKLVRPEIFSMEFAKGVSKANNDKLMADEAISKVEEVEM